MTNNRIEYQKRKLEIVKAFIKAGIFKAVRESISVEKDILKDRKFNSESEKRLGRKLKQTFENLGPTFVKLGQIMSTRRDIFSKEVIEELEKLQDDVDPVSFYEIKEVFYEEFQKDIYDVFEAFNPKPIASGSIAQAHDAILKVDGKNFKVCVKVQRKNIKEKISLDIKILEDLIDRVFMKTPLAGIFDLKNMLREFKNNLYFEMDFNIEAKNLIKFSRYNKRDKYIHFPKLYEKYTSTKVMTMEYIDGVSIKNLDDDPGDFDKRNLANRLVYSYVNQFFRDGYFHADPHSGNIMVLDDDHLALIDFGIMGKLSNNYRYQIMKIFMGISYDQTRLITDAVIGMGLLRASRTNVKEFEMNLQHILDKYLELSLHEMKLTDMITEFFDLLRAHKIKIPSTLFNFGKTVIVLEGVVERLVENQSLVELAYPIAKKINHRFFSKDTLKARAIPKIYDFYSVIKELPEFTISTMRQVSDGGISIKIKQDFNYLKERKKIEDRRNLVIIFLALAILFSSALIAFAISGIEIAFVKKFLKFILILVGAIIVILLSIIFYKFIRKE